MRIWIINNYAMLPEHGHLTRHYYFAKELAARGHEVTVFAGSHIHNTDIQLVDGMSWRVWQEHPFRWVYVHTLAYGRSRKKQVLSMFQFYSNASCAAQYLKKREGAPDVIIGSSVHPLAAQLGIRLARRYGCKSIAEIRDLWPESIVAFGIAGPHNPAVLFLRWLEKWIYKKADAVVFTMEGAYDYIVEQGWENEIPRSKVYHINNGVDLEQFDYNKEHYRVEDPDLDDPSTFKAIYTGSVRLANNPDLLIDCAKYLLPYPDIRLLIYGGGENLDALRQTCETQGLTNCIFKGAVPKKNIPYILSKSDLNLLNYDLKSVGIFKYGSSQNKLFDYMASGRPILANVSIAHSLIRKYSCGQDDTLPDAETYAKAVLAFYHMDEEQRRLMGANARRAAEDYDFSRLADKLMAVIESIAEKQLSRIS